MKKIRESREKCRRVYTITVFIKSIRLCYHVYNFQVNIELVGHLESLLTISYLLKCSDFDTGQLTVIIYNLWGQRCLTKILCATVS